MNSTGVCTSFKVETYSGIHNLVTDTFMAALYYASGSLSPATTAYSATNEVVGGGYTAGGIVVPNTVAPTSSGTTAYWTPSASLSWSLLTIAAPFDTVLIYNASKANRAVVVFNFGSTTLAGVPFKLTMPINAAGSALLNQT